MVCFLLMATAPLARHVVTIMGSISGVRPTAMLMANRPASSQLPFVTPLIKKTNGTITIIKRMSTHETLLTPLEKLVSAASSDRLDAMEPNRVCSPTLKTSAVALPDITLLPMRAMFSNDVAESDSVQVVGTFSTGSLSPVRLAWPTKRSLASIILTSAGIMSPADRCTMSPTTTSSMGISVLGTSLRVTVTVVVIMSSSFSAALPLRASWT